MTKFGYYKGKKRHFTLVQSYKLKLGKTKRWLHPLANGMIEVPADTETKKEELIWKKDEANVPIIHQQGWKKFQYS